jgi:flagellar motor switch protein FliG
MLLEDMETFVRVPIDDIISAQGKVVAQVNEWLKTGQFRYDKKREEDLLEEWRGMTENTDS